VLQNFTSQQTRSLDDYKNVTQSLQEIIARSRQQVQTLQDTIAAQAIQINSLAVQERLAKQVIDDCKVAEQALQKIIAEQGTAIDVRQMTIAAQKRWTDSLPNRVDDLLQLTKELIQDKTSLIAERDSLRTDMDRLKAQQPAPMADGHRSMPSQNMLEVKISDLVSENAGRIFRLGGPHSDPKAQAATSTPLETPVVSKDAIGALAKGIMDLFIAEQEGVTVSLKASQD
jgi:chromosome segregation ATPase